MLYGYRETVDNRVATLVVAGDTKNEYRNFIEVASGQVANSYRHGDDTPSNFEEMYTSLFLQHMTEELYKGYKMPVYVFYHVSNEQRELFITEFEIREVKSAAGRDRQSDMAFAEQQALRNAEKEALRKAEETGEEVENGATKTIEELYGLDKEDKWDRRSEAEKQEDADMRAKIKELQKEGKMSGDSFTGGKHDKKTQDKPDNGNVHVTDIVGETQGDGSFDISNIRAIKVGGGVDTALKEQRQQEHEAKAEAAKKGKRSFTPEDFAAVLKGDGSADHLNVKGDMDQRRGTKPIERPSLSEGAETARKEHQEQERVKAAERAAQAKRENDLTARGDRAKGIFRGADLGGESDIPLAELPQELQDKLKQALGEDTAVSVKDYPYNSELAGKILLPCSGMDLAVVDGVNLKKVGTISMGDAYAVVVELDNKEQDGWAIYQWPLKSKPAAEGEEPTAPRMGTSVVRVRNA